MNLCMSCECYPIWNCWLRVIVLLVKSSCSLGQTGILPLRYVMFILSSGLLLPWLCNSVYAENSVLISLLRMKYQSLIPPKFTESSNTRRWIKEFSDIKRRHCIASNVPGMAEKLYSPYSIYTIDQTQKRCLKVHYATARGILVNMIGVSF